MKSRLREPERPAGLAEIEQATRAVGFEMASDAKLGSLLRALAASKPRSAILELGTGTGIATAWLLDGMDSESTLLTIDRDEKAIAVAREHLGTDPRVSLVVAAGEDYLPKLLDEGRSFELVFADAWAGKYHHLEEALQIAEGGRDLHRRRPAAAAELARRPSPESREALGCVDVPR